jgi:hypothetical protein
MVNSLWFIIGLIEVYLQIWYRYLTIGIRAPSLAENCGLISFQGRDVFGRLKATEISHYAHKPVVGDSYTQEIQVVLKCTYFGHTCNPCWYPFEWYRIRQHLYMDRPRSLEALHI